MVFFEGKEIAMPQKSLGFPLASKWTV